jgi:hypothetical protein
VAWLGRFVRVHGLRSRDDLCPAEPTIASCRTDRAGPGHVAAATPNQAIKALVCLDQRVLTPALAGRSNAGRADTPLTVPVVLTRDDVAAVLSRLDGPAHLVATRLDGSGWRILAAVRLRGKDSAVPMKPLTVRAGQGAKDRCTTVPATLTPGRQTHLAGVKTWHQQASAQGPGEVSRPQALARQSPPAAKAGGGPDVFPARTISRDPRAGVIRRQHVAPRVLTTAITVAVRRAGRTKTISAHPLRQAFAPHLRQRGTAIRTIPPRLGHHELATPMLDPHILPPGGQGVPSPLDDLGV